MRRRAGNSGHALLGTMAFVVLMMLLWMASFAQLSGYTRVEKASYLRDAQATGPVEAMAWGLELLQTGLPPSNPYSCRMTASTGRSFVIAYTETAALKYTVTVRPALESDSELPAAPDRFSP